ncbi:MAG TPA: hypothetical protein DCZ94_17710 [Lentisphaeria bacterium]|nr:MAG: hypothetical protein A2X48_00365 [Lentisphaerae bacterium GWF2_49_21]HBC88782.1 hypothetical protein [Lentisphaeria bacterium]
MENKSAKKIDWSLLVRDVLATCFMSQQELAEYCGKSQQCVSTWLNGSRKPGPRPRGRLLELAGENQIDAGSYGIISGAGTLRRYLGGRESDELARIFSLYIKMSKQNRKKFLKYAGSITGG